MTFTPLQGSARPIPSMQASVTHATMVRPVDGGDVTVVFKHGAVASVTAPQRLQPGHQNVSRLWTNAH
jgi:hypothetical protein